MASVVKSGSRSRHPLDRLGRARHDVRLHRRRDPFGAPNTSRKPDVTAPTPENGRIVYGDQVLSLSDGWGTSEACPQVAGLAALLLSRTPSLSRQELFELIRNTAVDLGHGPDCQGRGMIDCLGALRALVGADQA